MKFPRLAARALIVQDGKLLLVNAYPDGKSDLWCAPGGGVEAGQSLIENLKREVQEETGLSISVGDQVGTSEFFNPADGFHQVDLFFRATIVNGEINDTWKDPENVVTTRQFFSPKEKESIRYKPDTLFDMAFDHKGHSLYDPFEPIVS